MLTLLRDRINASWLLLVVASLVSWETAQTSQASGLYGVGQLAITIAFLKALVVGREFMELRLSPRALRWTFFVWTVAIGGVLVAIYSL